LSAQEQQARPQAEDQVVHTEIFQVRICTGPCSYRDQIRQISERDRHLGTAPQGQKQRFVSPGEQDHLGLSGQPAGHRVDPVNSTNRCVAHEQHGPGFHVQNLDGKLRVFGSSDDAGDHRVRGQEPADPYGCFLIGQVGELHLLFPENQVDFPALDELNPPDLIQRSFDGVLGFYHQVFRYAHSLEIEYRHPPLEGFLRIQRKHQDSRQHKWQDQPEAQPSHLHR
jgi:hypothetical protein